MSPSRNIRSLRFTSKQAAVQRAKNARIAPPMRAPQVLSHPTFAAPLFLEEVAEALSVVVEAANDSSVLVAIDPSVGILPSMLVGTEVTVEGRSLEKGVSATALPRSIGGWVGISGFGWTAVAL